MSNLPTTITIDGKEYELVPKSEGKRDWGILSLKDSVDGRVYPFTSMPDNRFSINSVKRLSDGEVFTVGDKIGWGEIGNYETTLLSFRINNGRLEFEYPATKKYLTFCDFEQAIRLHKKAPSPSVERPPIGIMPEWIWKEERLKEIDTAMSRYVEYHKNIPEEWLTESAEIREWLFKRKKIKSSLTTVEKEPRFITEDRKNIFEGDRYAYVPKETLAWVNVSDGKSTPQPESSFLYFSTEQAANDYVIMNKRCLSLNDVKKFIEDNFNGWYSSQNPDRLKQLVQDRINTTK